MQKPPVKGQLNVEQLDLHMQMLNFVPPWYYALSFKWKIDVRQLSSAMLIISYT